MEKELKEIINSLTAAFWKESEERYSEVADQVLEKYPAESMTPEKFASLVSFDIIARLHEILAKRYFPEVQENRQIQEFVLNYSFLDTMVKQLIETVRGTPSCCADCSR